MEYMILSAVLLALVVWIAFDNKRLTVSRYTVKSDRLPDGFSGFKIVQISDLHGAVFGKDNRKLLACIKVQRPDIIIITGDIINSRNPDLAGAVRFAEAAGEIAPVYFSSGNHESRLDDYSAFCVMLESAGVTVLENGGTTIERNGAKLALLGLTDPRFVTDYSYRNSLSAVRTALDGMETNPDTYNILLAHRPELMEAYSERGIDLVFSGHAHGGQFRLPVLGGIFVPNQGFFPKYDAGLFTEGRTKMIVSRGLGKSIIPVRIGNPPEITVAELTNGAE